MAHCYVISLRFAELKNRASFKKAMCLGWGEECVLALNLFMISSRKTVPKIGNRSRQITEEQFHT